MTTAALALGSNLGNRLEHLRAGVAALGELPTTRLAALSGVVETPALVPPGQPPGPDYLNEVVLIETDLAPTELLRAALEIERLRGRERSPGLRWEARTLDIDLLYVDQLVVEMPGLRLPHPEMHRRDFVLAPLARIAPQWRHPLLHQTAAEMLGLAMSAAVAAAGR